jgi:hypothetical protein
MVSEWYFYQGMPLLFDYTGIGDEAERTFISVDVRGAETLHPPPIHRPCSFLQSSHALLYSLVLYNLADLQIYNRCLNPLGAA